MNNESKVRASSLKLSTLATTTRTTPRTNFGQRLKDGLIKVGSVAADGLNQAAPFIPGGAILSAALASGNSAAALAAAPVSTGTGASYGTNSFALTAGGSGPIGGGTTPIGGFNSGGTLTIPGRRPNLGTDLSTNPASFATGAASTAANSSTDSFNQMMTATRQMTEFQASFNMQYLQLQEKIQQDTRQFNLISNIMKTKHDAAKNALNNVR